jgi:hypothetical protein
MTPDVKRPALIFECNDIPVITITKIRVHVMKKIFNRHVTRGVNHTYISINPVNVKT